MRPPGGCSVCARGGIYMRPNAFDTLASDMPIPLPTHTLVLNASHEPLSVVPLRRAFTLVEAGKADLIESAGGLRPPSRTFDAPAGGGRGAPRGTPAPRAPPPGGPRRPVPATHPWPGTRGGAP